MFIKCKILGSNDEDVQMFVEGEWLCFSSYANERIFESRKKKVN